eukprot:3032609-Amphidinium_carterae.1
MGSLLQDRVELAWLWNKMLPNPLANFQRIATMPDSSTDKVQHVALESRQPRNQGLLASAQSTCVAMDLDQWCFK